MINYDLTVCIEMVCWGRSSVLHWQSFAIGNPSDHSPHILCGSNSVHGSTFAPETVGEFEAYFWVVWHAVLPLKISVISRFNVANFQNENLEEK